MAGGTQRGRHPWRGSGVPGDLVRAFPLPTFFVLAYLLSWAYWLVALGVMGRTALAWFVPGAFGPPLAALVVTRVVDGRAGLGTFLRRWVRWRVAPRWYLLAMVGLPALGLVGVPLRDGAGRFAGSAPAVIVTYLATLSFLVVLGGGQEEPGWRGFALPRMQPRLGPVQASVVLGLLWGSWHLPVFVLVPGYNSTGPGVVGTAAGVLVFVLVGAVGQSLILTWLSNNTRGSVLLAVLAHASLNAGTAIAPGRASSVAVFVAFGVVGVGVTLGTRGTLSYHPAGTPVGPESPRPTDPRRPGRQPQDPPPGRPAPGRPGPADSLGRSGRTSCTGGTAPPHPGQDGTLAPEPARVGPSAVRDGEVTRTLGHLRRSEP